MEATELEVAKALEFEILSQGFKDVCGCTKFILCSFPNSSWYYATFCFHEGSFINEDVFFEDRVYWWYDFTNKRFVTTDEFEVKYLDELWAMDGDFLQAHVDTSLFHIRRDGMVRHVTSKRTRIGGGGMWTEWK